MFCRFLVKTKIKTKGCSDYDSLKYINIIKLIISVIY